MSLKRNRQNAIQQIIRENDISCQDDFLLQLEKLGFVVTQATLSRDLKEMGIIKVHKSSHGYVYKISNDAIAAFNMARNENVATGGIRGIEFSGNLAVVRTTPGFASAIASVLDSHLAKEISGTVAGDDTVLLVIREGYDRTQVMNSLSSFFKGIQSKIQ